MVELDRAARQAPVPAPDRPAVPPVGSSTERRMRPVLWWAALGAVAVVLQLSIYLRWVTSPDFHRVGTGPDPVPHREQVLAWVLQSAFGAVAVLTTLWLVAGCIRQRRLTFDAKISIGWVSVIWLDHWANLVAPQMLFNSYYLNMGSWDRFVPGWLSHNPANLPAPFLIEFACYAFMVLITIAGCRLMIGIKRRWPSTGLVGLTASTWLAMAAFVFCIEELVVIRGGWVWWTGSIAALTPWHGTSNAMPLTEVTIWAVTITATCVLRYRHQSTGTAPAELGLDRVSASRGVRGALSTFAVIGWCTVAMGFYSVFSAGLALYADPWPSHIPSYFTNGICGQGTPYACPDGRKDS
jgi:hypothetical protein